MGNKSKTHVPTNKNVKSLFWLLTTNVESLFWILTTNVKSLLWLVKQKYFKLLGGRRKIKQILTSKIRFFWRWYYAYSFIFLQFQLLYDNFLHLLHGYWSLGIRVNLFFNVVPSSEETERIFWGFLFCLQFLFTTWNIFSE